MLSRLGEECRHVPHSGGSHRLRDLVLGRFEQAREDDAFPMQPPRALWEIRAALGREDILISDVGLHKLWIARMFPAHEPNTVMIANGLAGMGFAVPTAIAAKLVHPERKVVTVNGDGGFLMNFQELETARRLGTPFVNVVWENQQYGSIVWKQDKRFGRHFGTDFDNPDFVRLAESFGLPAWRCESVEDFPRHLRQRARAGPPVGDRAADRLLDRRGDLGGAGYGDRHDMSGTITRSDEQRVLDEVPKQLYVGGEWRDAREGGTLPVEDPSTGESLCEVADARPEDGLDALDAAARAQGEWADHPPRERGEILRRAFEALTARADELALLMTLEMGKPVAESKAEIAYASEFFRWFAEEAVRIEGRYVVNQTGTGRVLTLKQPVGPCLLITPWNFPMAMGTRKIGPAVAAGCTMVVKPASQTPLSMLALGAHPRAGRAAAGRAERDHDVLERVGDGPADRGPARAQALVHGLDRDRPQADGAGVRAAPARCRWSSAATRPSSSSTTPTSTPRSRAPCWPRCATSARRARRPTASTWPAPWPTSSPRSWRSGSARLKVGRGTEEDVKVGPLIDDDQRSEGLGAGRATRSPRARVPWSAAGARRPRLLLRADRARRRPRRRAAAQGGDLRPGRARRLVRRRAARRSPRPTTPSSAWSPTSTRATWAARSASARGWRPGMVGLNQGMVSNAAAPFGGVKQSGFGREGGHEGIEEYLEVKYVAMNV